MISSDTKYVERTSTDILELLSNVGNVLELIYLLLPALTKAEDLLPLLQSSQYI